MSLHEPLAPSKAAASALRPLSEGDSLPSVLPPETLATQIERTLGVQRNFFNTGATRSYAFRMQQLQNLQQLMSENVNAIVEALSTDLKRPELETLLAEINVVLEDIHTAKRKLKKWMKPKRVGISYTLFPATGRIVYDPYGVVLILGPWNYPLQLLFAPLVGALAAGNCAVLKPSEMVSATSQLIAKLVAKYFDPGVVTAVLGGIEVSQALLAQRFDYIFFTGGSAVGKIVMRAAAEHLTPVTLELGGKSPCIIEPDANLEVTARRVAWGKFLNAGQTCVAPDYLLIHKSIQEPFLKELQQQINIFFGKDPQASPDFGRIVTDQHHARLTQFLSCGKAVIGGVSHAPTRYIAPTVLVDVAATDPVMQDEIFGPILPVFTYTDFSEALAQVNARSKPLALYLFTNDEHKKQRLLAETSSGAVGFNETVMQVGVGTLPFGGVGASGLGRYHGHFSFETFSHQKAVLSRPFWLDIKLRYAPYTAGKTRFIRRLFGLGGL